MIFFTINRFEGNIAILENRETKEMLEVSLSSLPNNSKEGDILKWENHKFLYDKKKTKQEKKRIHDKFQNLRKIKE